MENLTEYQKELINSLTSEFIKLNNPNTDNGKFSLQTIKNFINKEQTFINSIKTHNLAIIKVIVDNLNKEMAEFENEFGEHFNIRLADDKFLENMTNGIKKCSIQNCVTIHINHNFKNNGTLYLRVNFKFESITKKIEGSCVNGLKLVGYDITKHLPTQQKGFDSINELLQKDLETQNAMIRMCK